MYKYVRAAALGATAFCAVPSAAQEYEPESISVETAIKPGPNVFVMAGSWDGAGAVYVYSAEDLSYKGDVPTGLTGQLTLSPDARTIYSTSIFPKRITYGPIEAVLQTYDVETLALKSEVIIPSHVAQTMANKQYLQIVADGRFAIAQNATPATSVTVVDLASGVVASEVPLPGCWGIYPATAGAKFSALCGDGTFTTVTLDGAGKVASQEKSAVLFNFDDDPVFVHSERAGADLLFLSNKGMLHRVSDSGATVKLVDSFSIVAGSEGWAPGGYEIMAYNKAHNVLFVPMHSGAEDGSHKNGSEEIWAVDLRRKDVLYRSLAEHITNVAVTQGASPVLFGVNSHEGSLYMFEVDPDAKFAAKLVGEVEGAGELTLVLAEP